MLRSFRLTEDSFTIRLSKVLKLLKSYMIALMFNDTWQPSTTAIMEISFNAWPMWNKLPKMIDTCILITPFMLEKWKSRSSHNFWNHIEGKSYIEFMDRVFFRLKEFWPIAVSLNSIFYFAVWHLHIWPKHLVLLKNIWTENFPVLYQMADCIVRSTKYEESS